MKIRFLTDFLYRNADPAGEPFYQAGQEYDVREDRGRKWLREGLAVSADAPSVETSASAAQHRAATEAGPTAAGRAEQRAVRGVDVADPGTGAPPPPDAMTTADFPQPVPPSPAVQSERAAWVPGAPVPVDDLENYRREDLLLMLEHGSYEMPAGYLSKPLLIKILRREPRDA